MLPKKNLSSLFIFLTLTGLQPVFSETWTGSSSSAWEDGSNWSNGTVPAEGNRVFLNAGSVIDYTVGDLNLRAIEQSGGVLNILDSEFRVTELASATTTFDGTVNQSGGFADINRIFMGNSDGVEAQYNLSGGEFRIARSITSPSISEA